MKLFASVFLSMVPLVPLAAGTIPEIDRNVPSNLEVATFGLG